MFYGSEDKMCPCVCKQKVVERFHRNRSKPTNEDVAERVFLLAQRQIEVTYHLEDHRFIPSKRSFVKPLESTEQTKAEDFTPDMVSSFQVQKTNTPHDMYRRFHHSELLMVWYTLIITSVCVCVGGGLRWIHLRSLSRP